MLRDHRALMKFFPVRRDEHRALSVISSLKPGLKMLRGVSKLSPESANGKELAGVSFGYTLLRTMDCDAAERELATIVASRTFTGLSCLQAFLRFIVMETLAGRSDQIKETAIALAVYHRGSQFDPRCDSIVRVEAVKLRQTLERYYRVEGYRDPLIVSIPKGRYIPYFQENKQACDSLRNDVEELCSQGYHLIHKATPETFAKGQECLWTTVRLAPNNAVGYARLAESYAIGMITEALSPLTALPYLRMAAAAALQLQNQRSETLTCAALAAAFADYNMAAATEFLQRSIITNPRNASAHYWCGAFLSAEGRFEQARVHMREAVRLKPESPLFSTSVALCEYFGGGFREARNELLRVLEREPDCVPAHHCCGLALGSLGRHDEALNHMLHAKDITGSSPPSIAQFAYAQARAGNREEAELALDSLSNLPEDAYVPPSRVALVYGLLDRMDDAETALLEALKRRDSGLIWKHHFPDMAPLSTGCWDKLLVYASIRAAESGSRGTKGVL